MPAVGQADAFYLRAFWELSSCRQFGMGGQGPIPWNAIAFYADRVGLDPIMAETFEDVIRALDETYLEDLDRLRKQS